MEIALGSMKEMRWVWWLKGVTALSILAESA